MTRLKMITASLFAAAISSTALRAQPVADFYRGKTVEIVVGAAVAGGYDLAARTLANHYGRHVPGGPKIIVRNMPGATGLIGTNYLYNVAKRDGTVIGMPTSNVPLEPRLKLLSTDGSAVKFDLARFSWIGTTLQEPQVTWLWHTAPINNVEDLKVRAVRMGATSNSADNFVLPMLVNALVGTRMQPITGYVGQNEIDLAVERGEVQGNNTGLSNLTVNKSDWVRDRKVKILLQFGNERLAVLRDVPTVAELTASELDREVLRFYALKFTMTRPLLIPPDVPAERATALQEAFAATMQDTGYLEEARRIGLDTNWLGSAEIARQARQIQEAPQAVVDRLRETFGARRRQMKTTESHHEHEQRGLDRRHRAAYAAHGRMNNLARMLPARQMLEMDPVSGAEIETLVQRIYDTPAEVIELVRKINAAR